MIFSWLIISTLRGAFAAPPSGRTVRSHRLGERGGTTPTGLGWSDLDRTVQWEEGAANKPEFASKFLPASGEVGAWGKPICRLKAESIVCQNVALAAPKKS